jgi:small subunit ribosomal protein S9
MPAAKKYYSTGRRKTSVARVWVTEGTGSVTVNKLDVMAYFGRETSVMVVNQAFDVTETKGRFNVIAYVNGGGKSGQAGALRHGLSRALTVINPDWRGPLKKAGLMTRDPRQVERKKYGRRKARRRFQFSKR